MVENLKKNSLLLEEIFVFAGVFGFFYEEIFYYFDLGYLVKRGITFGPWIPIYAFGAILITLLGWKLRKKPFFFFLLSIFLSGVVEFFTGYVLDHFFHTRLWDYNVEILNFGNIGGYICFRSVFFFGLSSLFLFYFVIPMFQKINLRFSVKRLEGIVRILFYSFLFDIILSCIL